MTFHQPQLKFVFCARQQMPHLEMTPAKHRCVSAGRSQRVKHVAFTLKSRSSWTRLHCFLPKNAVDISFFVVNVPRFRRLGPGGPPLSGTDLDNWALLCAPAGQQSGTEWSRPPWQPTDDSPSVTAQITPSPARRASGCYNRGYSLGLSAEQPRWTSDIWPSTDCLDCMSQQTSFVLCSLAILFLFFCSCHVAFAFWNWHQLPFWVKTGQDYSKW